MHGVPHIPGIKELQITYLNVITDFPIFANEKKSLLLLEKGEFI